MLTDRWELGAIGTDHAQRANFASPAKVKERQANNTHFLVRPRSTTPDETCGILPGAHLKMMLIKKKKAVSAHLIVRILTINTFTSFCSDAILGMIGVYSTGRYAVDCKSSTEPEKLATNKQPRQQLLD